jgi:aspartyl-tRNA(Asn)/glutamyl-tRNA(Gln) amidotransferase subunit C
MARVTPETVAHVARLARLSLTLEERETFARQLDQILAYAESIQGLDVAGVEPMSHAGAAAALREDDEGERASAARAGEGAPDFADGLFRVPRILGG